MTPAAVAIVASAGGIGQLKRLLGLLPPDFPVPILCMYPPSVDERNIRALQVELPLRVEFARAGERPRPGVAYFPPSGTTILMRSDGVMALAPFGPESSTMQPEMTFLTSVAEAYGASALAVIVASDGDGTLEGARLIRAAGGSILAADSGARPYTQAIVQVIRGGQWDQLVPREELALAIKLRVMGHGVLRHEGIARKLDRLLVEFLEGTATPMGDVTLLDRDAAGLRMVAHRGLDAEFVRRFGFVELAGRSPCARAAREHRRILIPDVQAQPAEPELSAQARAAGFRALQCTPISAHGVHVVGVFCTRYPHPHEFSESQRHVFDDFASDAGEVVAGPFGP